MNRLQRKTGREDPQVAPPFDADANQILTETSELVAKYFAQLIKRYTTAPPRLMESIDYSLSAGGKRFRPALILECARIGPEGNGGEPNPSALSAAAAMELIHTFSLVHDDLPAMDDDDLRRGRPTNHKVFGEAMAILAGDAMTTMAFEILATDAKPSVSARLVAELCGRPGQRG